MRFESTTEIGLPVRRRVRWLRFNLVGLVGVGIQLAALGFLVYGLGLHYAVATVIAVELTIIHNFIWHERWTWKDRRSRFSLKRLAAFNFSSGLLSLIGNVVVTPALVEGFGISVILANFAAIAACSLANFFLADAVVFHAASVRQRKETKETLGTQGT